MNYSGYKSNSNVVYSCKYHVVWCPKYRRKLLINDRAARLRGILYDVARGRSADIIEREIMPDHVHVKVEVDPQYGIHKLIKQMKGISSHALRAEFKILRTRVPTLWTNSYFVSSVGGAPLAVIKQYIENQKKD